MITRHFTITVDKEIADNINDPKYIDHFYLKVAHDFAEELAKHIEPRDIHEIEQLGGGRMAVLHFELTGGSLPDHESDT